MQDTFFVHFLPLFARLQCRFALLKRETSKLQIIFYGDGEYWIDPGRTENTFKAYCDMTTDRGMV